MNKNKSINTPLYLVRFSLLCLLCLLSIQTHAQFNTLEEAYKRKSESKLDDFFLYWKNDIPSISDDEFYNLSDTIQQAYKAFICFYNPTNIEQLGGSEWGDTIYKHVDYLVIQNNLIIKFSPKVFYTEDETKKYYSDFINSFFDESEYKRKLQDDYKKGILQTSVLENWGYRIFPKAEETTTDTISNFRPSISLDGKKVTYLSSLYNIGLTSFLGSRIQKYDNNVRYTPVLSEKEILKRQTFLEKRIKIWKGHWGNYWQLLSYPQVFSIVFDKDMKYAKIYFRIVYQGGEAILENTDGKWFLKSSKRTWIE